MSAASSMTPFAGQAPRLLAWGAVVDGRGSLAAVQDATARLAEAGLVTAELAIAPLAEPWGAPPDPTGRRFKSGCAPILALARARELLAAGAAEAVVIRGEEPLRSGYGRAARRAAMAIWPGRSIPEAYTDLARAWMAHRGVGEAAFRALADALLESCARTALARGLRGPTRESRATFVTELFTRADCAHPEVDFAGAVVLGADRAAEALGASAEAALFLRAVAVETAPDGPEHAAALAGYAHLARAWQRLVTEAGLDLVSPIRRGAALLEAYTCFPPVPLGFLCATGIVSSPEELPAFLLEHEVTVTGGMNLARAPWNNPVLHALVVMADRMAAGGPPLGVLHGNGGLGGWQGLALLARGG